MTIVEQEPARQAINEAEVRWSRADSVWQEVIWIISHDPEAGTPITESGQTRALTHQGARSLNKPDVVVVYELQNPYVIIHEARFRDAKTYVRQEH